MNDGAPPVDDILRTLQERAKELNCLYRVDEILASRETPLEELFRALLDVVPAGWQYPAVCQARITFRGQVYEPAGHVETPWFQTAPIVVQGERLGAVTVSYTEHRPDADEGPFLKEERKLIDTIADRLAQCVLHRELTAVFATPRDVPAAGQRPDWWVVLDLLRRTDQALFRRIARKMLNHLSCAGVEEAKERLTALCAQGEEETGDAADENRPRRRTDQHDVTLGDETFRTAAEHLPEREILSCIQVWIKEDRVNFLLHALESSDSSLTDIASSLERYQHTGVQARELSMAMQVGLKTALVRRVLTEHLEFLNTSRRFLEVEDFVTLFQHTVLLPRSHGRLGGKSSGLFLADRIVQRSKELAHLLSSLKVPNTWYLPSDGILRFIAHNDLDDVYNWRYRELDQIRQEYPHMLQVFKNSSFPQDMARGLASVVEQIGDRPLIVRSSSLLEDRAGSAFSGKYKSLFLANRGDTQARLAALLDAIAEVYASTFSPDPIQYRAERGLLEHHEEMAIMIQEVVGTRTGRYFFPAFSGVGFSNNELRWSPRIKREDGLLRLVPGLGTRAVDRMADDYSVLIAPGQPGLRVNVTPDEAFRYSPKKIDVINLETNAFETLELADLLREVGTAFPALHQLVSVLEHDRLRAPSPIRDLDPGAFVFTFEGLVGSTPFVARMRTLLGLLRDALGTPVDVEFASDGQDLYLVQCRPQSYGAADAPAPIPRDLAPSQVLFSAHRYVSNGTVPDITHVVYVDPDGYSRLADYGDLRDVGRAVGSLNKLLPKRQFVLIGPGRWGSRGDIRLGVSVTYADISNAAVLIEVARKRGHYVPDLSFGTHFFQDLVESRIRYLPLYPDDPGVVFNEAFLRGAPNLLTHLLPQAAHLADTVRVLDVPGATGGRVLRILMNADLDEAVGILASPGAVEIPGETTTGAPSVRPGDDHWRWRLRMAQRIASEVDAGRFGVKGLYVFGSTKNATAGPGSDIDLLIHFGGTEEMRRGLELWLEGWSLCLAELNFLRTGYRSDGLLDVRIVTDEDVARRDSFASKIGAVTDPARPLPIGKG